MNMKVTPSRARGAARTGQRAGRTTLWFWPCMALLACVLALMPPAGAWAQSGDSGSSRAGAPAPADIGRTLDKARAQMAGRGGNLEGEARLHRGSTCGGAPRDPDNLARQIVETEQRPRAKLLLQHT